MQYLWPLLELGGSLFFHDVAIVQPIDPVCQSQCCRDILLSDDDGKADVGERVTHFHQVLHDDGGQTLERFV